MKIFKRASNKSDINTILYNCSKGNQRAQEQLYKMYYSYAISIALRYSENRNSAAEILNDSFLKTFKFLSEGGKIENFPAWLRKTIINQAIDYYRKDIKLPKAIDYEEGLPEIILNDDIVGKLTAEDIIKQLQKLPDIYRLIFILFEIEGYSHSEISEKLGITEVSSRKYLSRSRYRLKELLLKSGIYEHAG